MIEFSLPLEPRNSTNSLNFRECGFSEHRNQAASDGGNSRPETCCLAWKRRCTIVQMFTLIPSGGSLIILDCLTAHQLSDLASYRPPIPALAGHYLIWRHSCSRFQADIIGITSAGRLSGSDGGDFFLGSAKVYGPFRRASFRASHFGVVRRGPVSNCSRPWTARLAFETASPEQGCY